MLIACPSCDNQYDAGSHEPGAIVRCFCGVAITVPEPRPRDLRMLHCSCCGASLPEGSTTCDYCAASVGLGEKGLGEVCPGCMARMVKDARFCSDCGIEIKPQAMVQALADLACPRCAEPLAECVVPGTRLIECTSCAGLWLDEATFQDLTREREAKSRRPVPGEVTAAERPALQAQPLDVKYLGCPVCGERMHRRNFAKRSGVIIDWCRGHGVWFDADELARIMSYIDAGGLDRARSTEAEERESEARRSARAQADRMLARGAVGGAGAGGLFGRPRRAERSLLDELASLVSWLLH